jgi:hypothetical protein
MGRENSRLRVTTFRGCSRKGNLTGGDSRGQNSISIWEISSWESRKERGKSRPMMELRWSVGFGMDWLSIKTLKYLKKSIISS